MDEGVRSVGPSGVLVKKNSSGCLIVRKKPEKLSGAVGPSSARKVFEPKEKKRSRLVLSESGSSDEILARPRRKVGPETTRVCNGLRAADKGIAENSEFGQKRERLDPVRRSEDGMIGKSYLDESGGKRSKLEVYEFDEYDEEISRRKRFSDGVGEFGGRRFSGAIPVPLSGIKRECETGSSRHVVDKRKNSYFDRTSSLNRGDHTDRGGFEMNRDGAQLPLLRDKFTGQSEESIRLQGKNGVLKVMVKKKKNAGGPLENFRKSEENRKALRSEDIVKNAIIPPFYSEPKLPEKPVSVVRPLKNHPNVRKSLPSLTSKGSDWDSEDSDTSLKQGPKSVEASKPRKMVVCKDEGGPSCEKTPPTRIKEGKVKRGSGTEKQKLRERIREMLLSAGWTIDYRPRRNRDYLDAVYINPAGTAYWSIIKAYDALQKQLDEEENEAKPSVVSPITDDVLSQLTRKTRKKIEKEMKRKQRVDDEDENARGVRTKRSTSIKRDQGSMDSVSYEDKLSTYLKQGGKTFKSENGLASVNSNHLHEGIEKPSSGSSSHMPHGRKSRKVGRCTLLVRGSKYGVNSESDGFVPYTGKRTLLSWLVDSGTVQLSQKVQYMNRRRTKVMLEGWITRDGIHCGCCSKILTTSKFEIHAGSKLRQPFQNICLDSGVSLLQCQLDAWNRQKDIERIGFHSVEVDCDDPDDDTCGICGDGGDLICCDGCPSTFHQSCLNIQMLPPGDWHCPNCTCKFCGVANENVVEEDDITVDALLTCSLCGKKCHISCCQEMDGSPAASPSLDSSFCGQKCRELVENLKKYLGVKHELESGFSWTLVHRTDEDEGFPQRIECNSKLAVALTVMDECFLPIVDRRSGINLIHNVLYNCGSNFNRLNYSGFYTAILERGDEIISAASIRFHGTKLAEMPYIGTRHIYRRQGMCRRLFCAIESALCSLKVEKLVIPAIAELMHTWTEVFGFIPVEASFKQEMRSMNMLVFPGIDMLQKLLVDQENEGNGTADPGIKQLECKGKDLIKHGSGSKSDSGSPATIDHHGSDETSLPHINETVDEAAAMVSGSRCLGVSLNDSPVMSGSLDGSDEHKNLDSTERSVSSDSLLGAELPRSTLDKECPVDTSHKAVATEDKPVLDSPGGDKIQSTSQGPGEAPVIEDEPAVDSHVKDKMQSTCQGPGEASVIEDEPALDSPVEDKMQFASQGPGEALATEDEQVLDSPDEDKMQSASQGTGEALATEDEPVLGSSLEDKKQSTSQSPGEVLAAEDEPVPDSPVEDKMQFTSKDAAVSLNDTSMMSSRLSDNSNERNIQVSSKGATSSDSDPGTKSAEYASDVNYQSYPDISHDEKVEIEPVSDSSLKENYSKSLEESALDDSHEENVDASCLQPIPSSGETFAKNHAEEVNGNQDSSFCGASESSLLNNCDLNIQLDSKAKDESYVASEVASDAMQCEKSIPHASSDGSKADSGKAESGSV
ncbi:hypothetical protein ACFX2I_022024 [Malus domestica]